MSNDDKALKWFKFLLEHKPTELQHNLLIRINQDYHFAFLALMALAED